MRGVFVFSGAALLIAIVMWSAAALLPACGALGRIAGTWAQWCPQNTRAAADNQIAAVTDANRALELQILRRERELALMQCQPEVPEQAALPQKIDRGDWDNRRIGLLEGCWELDSRFVTTNSATGATSRYNVWTMCFDAAGNGREEMRADNGGTCSGPVTGRFNASGALIIDEPGNLQCSDNGYIYRLRSSCQLNENGTASCAVTQPEIGSSTTVEFRRSLRGN